MDQDVHNCGSIVIVSGFSELVFDINVGLLLSTPVEVADMADDYDVHVIGVLS